ncbi:hypothetical protein FRB90_008485 [Tulasnella sp. 427]|nr:hypothetical protein FRB90_008485 [Tulasnella sp. 427]
MAKPPPKKRQRFEKTEPSQKSNGSHKSTRYSDIRKKVAGGDDKPKKPAQVFERVRQPDPTQKKKDDSKPNNPTQLKSLRGIVKEKGKARAELSALESRPSKAALKSKPAALIQAEEHPHKPTTFKIIAGSYEKLLYGLEGTFPASSEDDRERPKPTLKPIFIFPAHVGSVRSVSASPSNGKWLATGSSADEVVKVWNLRQRKEVGGLFQHTGSITHLTFPSPHHLLSCSEDGTIVLYRTKDWAVLRVFKGHKGKVNCVAVHPSGKLALSVGSDRTIRMWDFMRGKSAGSTKIYKEAELVRWSTTGTKFVVQTLATIDVFSTSMTLLCQITHTARIQDLRFVSVPGKSDGSELLLVAGEDKKVAIYKEDKPNTSADGYTIEEPEEKLAYKVIGHFIGHDSRVKAVATLPITLPSGDQTTYLSTIGSDGKIHLYDLLDPPLSSNDASEFPQVSPIATYDTKGSRLTSLTMADDAPPQTAGKRKRDDDNDDGGNEEEEGEWSDVSLDEEQVSEGENEDEEEEEEEDDDDGGWGGVGNE